MNRERFKGFTLFELLVVLAIVALMLAVVPPMLPHVIGNAQVKSATRHLAAGLKYARSKAITSRQEVTLDLDVEDKTYSIENKDKRLNIPEQTKLTLITAESEQASEEKGSIRFFSDGSSTGGQIKLKHRKAEYIIDVNWLTGKVSILP